MPSPARTRRIVPLSSDVSGGAPKHPATASYRPLDRTSPVQRSKSRGESAVNTPPPSRTHGRVTCTHPPHGSTGLYHSSPGAVPPEASQRS
jgi:hypothetical protein